jgi:hypothetical protein
MVPKRLDVDSVAQGRMPTFLAPIEKWLLRP